jgi:hypothetical protein
MSMSLAGDRRFLVRGVAAGAGAMLVAVVLALMFVVALSGDPGPGWADRHAVAGVLLTALWCVAAAGAGAVGAWQAAEGGAPDHAAARLAGALGPAALIVVVSVAALGGEGASSAVVVVEGLVEIAAAVAGAAALARRLEAGW